MILTLIILGLALVVTIVLAITQAEDFAPWDRYKPNLWDYIKSLLVCGILVFTPAAAAVVIVYSVANAFSQRSTEVTYSQPLVTLQDGKGLEGEFRGSLFISRGYIADTQVFSYYRAVAPNQYVLEKRNANQSTVWTDTTAEGARLDITDKVYTCQDTWYLWGCVPKDTEFVHANFHIPEGSIQQDFTLDAK